MAVAPFKINILGSELDPLQAKLKTTRLPASYTDFTDDNGITSEKLSEILKYWQHEYDWREVEAKLNQLPQYTSPIDISDGFGTIDVHFIHSPSKFPNGVPLLFVHGWPGSCFEVSKGLNDLNKAGFDVIAPSLPGYGFSGYPRKKGFNIKFVGEVLQKLMLKLGYQRFGVQGGDWGSHIVRAMAIQYPENVAAMHVNMFQTHRMSFPEGQPEYTTPEKARIDKTFEWFLPTNGAYAMLQATKPVTLGVAMHDSPIGMLAWMYDKLVMWSDDYPWTPKEIITWTLLHYFPGPSTAFMMYMENRYPSTVVEGSWGQEHIKCPCGFSAFPKELAMMPRSWVERLANVKSYREHEAGGHFAMHERPEALVKDIVEFFIENWKP